MVPGSVDVPDLIVDDCAAVVPLAVELAVLKRAADLNLSASISIRTWPLWLAALLSVG